MLWPAKGKPTNVVKNLQYGSPHQSTGVTGNPY